MQYCVSGRGENVDSGGGHLSPPVLVCRPGAGTITFFLIPALSLFILHGFGSPFLYGFRFKPRLLVDVVLNRSFFWMRIPIGIESMFKIFSRFFNLRSCCVPWPFRGAASPQKMALPAISNFNFLYETILHAVSSPFAVFCNE